MSFEGRNISLVCVLAALAGTPLPALAQVAAPSATAPQAEPAVTTEASAKPAAEATAADAAAPTPPSPTASSQAAANSDGATGPTAPLSLDLAAALARVPGAASIDKRDRAALATVYEARKSAPIWMTPKGARPEAVKLAAEIAKADDWGLRASDFPLPSLEAASPDRSDLSADALADADVRLSLAALRYARHARAGRVDPMALTDFLDRKTPVVDAVSVLQQVATSSEPDQILRQMHPRHAEFERLRQRYLAVRDSAEQPKGGGPTEAERLLANMEQWRWMPTDLGAFHISVNIPEQVVRVVRDGTVIHTERVVVGKIDTQTPVFSDEMEQVIFHPFWGVPESIKTNEVLPGLRRGGAILAKQNLRLQLGGKDIDPAAYDWSRTDIRKFHVYQPPGTGNVLGVVKFRFPNKHDVYMHDTPSKSLFKSSVRAFSHGCMRVQDPVRLAELVLAEDRAMSPDRVRSLTLKDAPENNQINLTRRVPVHITYFTMRADDSGQLASFKDIYGHEERIRLGLEGKMHLVKPVPRPKTPAAPVGQLVEVSASFSGFSSGGSGSGPRPDWARRVFSGSDQFSAGN